ncbi:MAG: two-component regulator propeller domain-containing protein, partial [Bacteroidales bacterium]
DWYDNYEISHGLSSNYVECILEDSRGYIWIGTWDGLNRFDGFTFLQYKSDFTDTTNSLSGNWIFNIFEDKQHNLWICSNNGLSRYNYTQDNFEIIKTFYGFAVKSIVQGDNNYLWIGSIKGLFKYDYNTNKIVEYFSLFGSGKTQEISEINNILIDNKQNLWIATNNNGMFYFDTKSYKQINYRNERKNQSLPSNKILTLTFDNANRLWIGSFDNGIAIFDTTSQFIQFKQHDPNDKTSIGSNGVSKLFADSKGNMWICCQNGYLSRYNSINDNFIRYHYTVYSNSSLKTKSISYIYEDKLGNYWIGTHGNGIACLNKYKNQFKTYTVIPNLSKSLPDNKISSFIEMDDGNLIIGTDGGGICIFNPQDETFETYNTANGLISDAVTNLTKGQNSTIWISTWNGGIALFDYKTRKLKSFVQDNKNDNSIIFNNIKDVLLINDTLWIATHGEGIALYNTKSRLFTSYINKNISPFDLKVPTWANSLYRDTKKRLWIATSVFLYCYDGKHLKFYSMNGNKRNSISGNQVFSVFEDSNRNIWILTNGGIDKYDENEDAFEQYSKKRNFPQNAKAMIEDNNHAIWISAGAGIFRYIPQTDSLTLFTEEDGLPKNDFIYGATLKMKNGTLLFGGTNGFIMFHPDSLQLSKNKPVIKLTNLFIDHKLQIPFKNNHILQKTLHYTDTLFLDYSKKVVSIEIAGIDFSNSQAISYMYKIQGINKDWVHLGKERKITLPTLPPGSYILNVIALKSKDLHSENKKLVLIILPAWWQTWWFILLIILCLSGFVFMFFNFRLSQIKKQNRRLELTVAERTKELILANDELRELNNTKNKLFSIIAHDLKNPINILMGFASMLHNNYITLTETKKTKYIKQIAEASKNIFQQLEQLLDWAMTQSNRLTPQPENFDIATVINDSLVLLSDMFLNKKIIHCTSNAVSHYGYADVGMISTVVRNLITNALKFTNHGGTITVTTCEKNDMIEVSMVRSIVGMSEEQCKKLFKVTDGKTTHGTNNEKGTGLGLVICKEFVEKNGGEIHVQSKPGQGSRFTFTIPRGSELEKNKNIETIIE